MSLQCEVKEGGGVVTLDGELNAANVDSFRDQFSRWIRENDQVHRIVLDLAKTNFIDSAGLGVLIAMLKRVREQGGDIRIARLQTKARVVFEITRANKVFDIFETVEEALRARA